MKKSALVSLLKMAAKFSRRWAYLHLRLVIQVSIFTLFFSLITIFKNTTNFDFLPTKELGKEQFQNLRKPNQLKKLQLSVNFVVGKSDITIKSKNYKFQHTSQVNRNSESKKKCSLVSPILVGRTEMLSLVSALWKENGSSVETRMKDTGLTAGGKYKPKHCQSLHKVAIVVPFRNREDHLIIFLRYIHPFLQRQQLEYAIFVVEQLDSSPFNRGMLMNIGYQEALLIENFDCFIFHDIDFLPENDKNIYSCPENGKPRHMSFSIDIYDYKLTPIEYFGGVNAFSKRDFRKINGFSNVFWGWGGEDDDLYQRVLFQNFTVSRPFYHEPLLRPLTRYRTLYHHQEKPNTERHQLIEEGKKRFLLDGLVDLNYHRVDIKFKLLYTHIRVEIHKHTPSMMDLPLMK